MLGKTVYTVEVSGKEYEVIENKVVSESRTIREVSTPFSNGREVIEETYAIKPTVITIDHTGRSNVSVKELYTHKMMAEEVCNIKNAELAKQLEEKEAQYQRELWEDAEAKFLSFKANSKSWSNVEELEKVIIEAFKTDLISIKDDFYKAKGESRPEIKLEDLLKCGITR